VLQAVPALFLRLECEEGGQEVRGGESGAGPGGEVRADSFQILGVMGEGGGEGADGVDDLIDAGRCLGLVRGLGYRAVLDLEGLEGGGGVLSRIHSWFPAEIPVTAVVTVSVIVGCLSGCLLTMASVASNQLG
jgi:hypothetical protein